jgi:hypothetical protein
MEFVCVRSFDNYVSAHIAMGRLVEEGVNGWLKDENTVTIDPILTNAVGGIKLMAPAVQAERAAEILRLLENEHKKTMPCPRCNSLNIELVTTPRKASNWASALLGLFFISYAMPIDKTVHCFDCGFEYDAKENLIEDDDTGK